MLARLGLPTVRTFAFSRLDGFSAPLLLAGRPRLQVSADGSTAYGNKTAEIPQSGYRDLLPTFLYWL